MKLFSDTAPFLKANFHAHTTCSDGKLSPEECIFLDDREDNVSTARSLGIRSILVNHREEAFRTLFEQLAVCGQ